MGKSIQKITNSCGEVIEVGKSYQLNRNSAENACQKRESNLAVKVTEIRVLDNGWVLAKIDFPRDPQHNIYLQWVPVNRLYDVPLVSSVFRPLNDYIDYIQKIAKA